MNSDAILKRYCDIARPMMLKFMPPNSCIAATRVTCECLRRLGFKVDPVPMKFVVTIPERETAYTSGVSAKERATAKRSIRYEEFSDGWEGHLVAITNDKLIESAFDQAVIALSLPLQRPEIMWFPLPKTRGEAFHVEYFGHIDDTGEKIKIDYVTTGDHSYTSSEAWTDEGLPLLAEMILKRMQV